MKNILTTLNTKNNITSLKLDFELLNRQKNDNTVITVNKELPFFKHFHVLTSSFVELNSLIVDENIQYYYKQWQVAVFEAEIDVLNSLLKLLVSNLSYNIIYNETIENILDYYNTGNELRQMGFFSIEGNILFFNVSVFISKAYGGAEITNPQVALEITINPFLSIKN